MKHKKPTYETFKAYLDGKLTPDEQHQFEKESMSDGFAYEALEGFEDLSAEEFMLDMADLQRSISQRVTKRRSFRTYWPVAASIATLVGLGILGYQLLDNQKQSVFEPGMALHQSKHDISEALLHDVESPSQPHVEEKMDQPDIEDGAVAPKQISVPEQVDESSPIAGNEPSPLLPTQESRKKAQQNIENVSLIEPDLSALQAKEKIASKSGDELEVKTEIVSGTGQEKLTVIHDDTYLKTEALTIKPMAAPNTQDNNGPEVAIAKYDADYRDESKMLPAGNLGDNGNMVQTVNEVARSVHMERGAPEITDAIPPWGSIEVFTNRITMQLSMNEAMKQVQIDTLFLTIEISGKAVVDSVRPLVSLMVKETIQSEVDKAGPWTPAYKQSKAIVAKQFIRIKK